MGGGCEEFAVLIQTVLKTENTGICTKGLSS